MDLSYLEHEFFFISYPSFAGGAHLSNIISLGSGFYLKGKDTFEEYYNTLIELYNPVESAKKVAHFPNKHLLVSDMDFLTYVKDINTTRSVHLGHPGCFINNFHFNNIANKRVIVLTCATEGSKKLVGKREKSAIGTDSINEVNPVVAATIRYLGSRQYFETTHNIESKHIIEIEASHMFDADISFIVNKLNQEFNIDIPLDKSQLLHNQWLTNIVGQQ